MCNCATTAFGQHAGDVEMRWGNNSQDSALDGVTESGGEGGIRSEPTDLDSMDAFDVPVNRRAITAIRAQLRILEGPTHEAQYLMHMAPEKSASIKRPIDVELFVSLMFWRLNVPFAPSNWSILI